MPEQREGDPRFTEDNLIHRLQTEYADGFVVDELLVRWTADGKTCLKLIWARAPFEVRQVDGKDNPLVHVDFAESLMAHNDYLEVARRRCREAFDRYWNRNQSPLT
jgi:hypothetical protein